MFWTVITRPFCWLAGIDWTPEAVTAAATIALACLTLILAFGTLFLWLATKRLVRETRRTAERKLRAYVGIDYQEIRIEKDKDKLVAFVDYKNGGATPAHDVELKLSAKMYDFAIHHPPWEPPRTPADEGKGGVILPSVTWRRHCPVDVGQFDDLPALIEGLISKQKRVWVWGTISYVDIFNKHGEVQFRFWSSDIKQPAGDGHKHEYFALIPDIARTKAIYGK